MNPDTRQTVGYSNGETVNFRPRESEMLIVVIELWKGKSTVNEGALLRIKISGIKNRI